MSLEVNIGKRRNILEIGPENASQVFLHTSVIFVSDNQIIPMISMPFPSHVMMVCFWSRLYYLVRY